MVYRNAARRPGDVERWAGRKANSQLGGNLSMEVKTLGLILMSVAIAQYGVIPLVADLNATHAINPKWTPHARFHVVTQVLTGAAVAAVAMYLLWSPSVERSVGVCLAAVLRFCVLGAFFFSAAFRSLYGGALSDREGGMPKNRGIDRNTVNFGVALLLLTVGRLCLMR
jgi:hypothetical protein